MSDLINKNYNFKSWETLKNEYHLDNKYVFSMNSIDSRDLTNLETKN